METWFFSYTNYTCLFLMDGTPGSTKFILLQIHTYVERVSTDQMIVVWYPALHVKVPSSKILNPKVPNGRMVSSQKLSNWHLAWQPTASRGEGDMQCKRKLEGCYISVVHLLMVEAKSKEICRVNKVWRAEILRLAMLLWSQHLT